MRHPQYIKAVIISVAGFLFTLSASAQTQPYIQVEIVKVAGATTEGQVISLTSSQKTTSRSYLDGLGRTIQTVAIQASPLQKDIVQATTYDSQGRVTTGYLPYAATSNDGSFRTSAVTETSSFYSGTAKVATDGTPYTQQVFESSPLQRLLTAGSVGDGFQPVSGQHYKSANYRSNTSADNVVLWGTDAVNHGYYGANILSVTDGTNEDGVETLVFTNTSGQTLLKRQVANQTVNGVSVPFLDTYYIYNEAGAIAYVIQPRAVSLMQQSGNWSLSQSNIANLIFSYQYDSLGRVYQKTVPGGISVYIIYDQFNRSVLMQDANLRGNNQWNYIKYDVKGHAISQGIYTDATNIGQANMQAYVNSLTYSISYEKRSNNAATGYYTNNVFPTSNIQDLGYSYYDDYDLNNDGTADYTYQTQSLTNEATPVYNLRGVPTVVSTRSVGSGLSNIWLVKALFYDENGRVVQVQGNNQLNTAVNDVQTTVADFIGVPQVVKTIKTASGSATTVQTAYTYDNMNRVTAIDQSYNGAAAIRIGTYEYNEIGQLVKKNLHQLSTTAVPANVTLDGSNSVSAGGQSTVIASQSITLTPGFTAAAGSSFQAMISSAYLQSLDYRYNIRGQLLSINNSTLSNDGDVTNGDTNDVFGMELMYDKPDADLGATASYSGRVSGVKWMTKDGSGSNTNQRSYKYSYDVLNRLTASNYAERSGGTGSFNINNGGFDESGISYDENGNLLTLQRNSSSIGASGGTAVDNLTYTYDSNKPNQLLNITDGTGSSYTGFGFKNSTGSTGNYGYDTNGSGNLTGDPYKGLTLGYNILNKTDQITINTATGRYITYTYSAGGQVLRKQTYDNNTLQNTTDYIDGFVYLNGTLSYFGMPEGRVVNTSGTLKPEYIISDQQGNARFSFTDNGSGGVRILQENSYYSFGLAMANSPVAVSTLPNNNLYNGGSEWQNDFSNLPDYYQTFYRNYDAAIGRFISSDPMAESTESLGGYHYASDNPVMYNDPMGLRPLPSGAPDGSSGGGSIPNGYNRKGGPGSGDYWSDGIFLGDWSSNGGSNTFRALLAAGFDLRGSDFYDPTNGRKLTVGSNGTYTYADNGTSPPPTEGTALFYGMDGKLEQALPTGSTTSYLEILHKTSDGEYYYRTFPIKTIESAEIDANQGGNTGSQYYQNIGDLAGYVGTGYSIAQLAGYNAKFGTNFKSFVGYYKPGFYGNQYTSFVKPVATVAGNLMFALSIYTDYQLYKNIDPITGKRALSGLEFGLNTGVNGAALRIGGPEGLIIGVYYNYLMKPYFKTMENSPETQRITTSWDMGAN